MPIPNYEKPQVLIDQNLINTPSTGAPTLNALVIGPQFDLYRYTVPAEQAAMRGTKFVYSDVPGATQVIAYEGLANNANYIVDADFVQLYGEGLEGQLWATAGTGAATGTDDPNYNFELLSLVSPNMVRATFKVPTLSFTTTGSAPNIAIATVSRTWPSTGTPTIGGFSHTSPPTTVNGGITITGGVGTAASLAAVVNAYGVITAITVVSGGVYTVAPSAITISATPIGVNLGSTSTVLGQSLASPLAGRPVQVGDIFYATVDGVQTRRSVRSVLAESVPAFFGSESDGVTLNNSQLYAAAGNPTTANTGYTQAGAYTVQSGDLSTGVLGSTVTFSATGTGYDINNPPSTANGGIVITIGTGAVGAAVVSAGGQITGVNFTGGGTGYSSQSGHASSIRFAAPGMFGSTGPVNFYATNQGAGVTAAVATLATAPLTTTFSGGAITNMVLAEPIGFGYDINNPPSTANGGITIGTGTGASVTSMVNNSGQIYDFTIVAGGSGYAGSDSITFASPATLRNNALQKYLLTNGTAYAGQLGDRFTLTVTQGGAITSTSAGNVLFSIRTASGQYSANNVPLINYNGTNAAPAPFNLVSGDLNTGAIEAFSLGSPIGSGYDVNNPPSTGNGGISITIGSGAQVVATVSNSGQITGFALTGSGGSSYTTSSIVTVAAPSGYNVVESLPATMPGWLVKIVGAGSLVAGQSFSFNLLGTYSPLDLTSGTPDLSVVSGSVYSGTQNTTYTITVVAGGSTSGSAVVRVSDTAGVDLTSTVTVALNTPFNLGANGITAQFNSSGTVLTGTSQGANLKAGDVYFIDAVAASNSGVPSILVLNGVAADTTGWVSPTEYFVDIDYRTSFSGLVSQQGDVGTWNYYVGTAAQGGVLLPSGFQIFVPGRNVDYQWVYVQTSPNGLLFTTWRGLVPAQVNAGVQLWNDPTAIAAQFGVSDPDNTISYGATVALAGAQGKAIYIASVATNDSAGWTAALLGCQRLNGAYALNPLTHDSTLLGLCAAHIGACSSSAAKRWRRGYFPVTNPGQYPLLVDDSDGNPLTATVTAQSGQNVRVYAAEGTFVQAGVVPGDLFRTSYAASPWGDVLDGDGNILVQAAPPTYTQYVVASVVDDNELILVAGPTNPISSPQAFQLWKADTAASQIQYVSGVAEAYSNRRISGIWCDQPTIQTSTGTLQSVDLVYMCSEIAGLRTALYPQQGLTNTQVVSASNAPLMYSKYTETQLDTAAANGVWVIAQDAPGQNLYIRHQLTTDVTDGILAWEDSVGTNIDAICYDITAIQQPYIGRRNITNATVDELETDLASYFNTKKEAPSGLTDIGPQLVDWYNLTVGIDPNFADRIQDGVILVVPTPLNNITMALNATTANNSEITTVVASSSTAAS